MCSRYFLDADGNIIAYTFRVPPGTAIRKRFNIAPTQEAPVVRVSRTGDGATVALGPFTGVPPRRPSPKF